MGVCPRYVALASSVVIAFAALACAAACSSFAAAGTPGDLVAESGTDALAVDGTASEASPDTDAASGEAAFVLARDYPDLGAVTATDTTVYFTQPTPGAVRSVDLETGGAVSDMQLNEGTPASIVVLGSKVVWGDRSKSTLRSRSLDGGDITTQTLAGGLRPVAIAVAADKLVVVATGAGDSGKLQVYDSALTLETSTAAAYQNPWDVAVLGSSVWWTESGGNAIWRATLPGFTVPTTIATVESDCRAIAVDPQGKLFWARYDDNLVRGFGMSGAFTLSPGEVNPTSVVANQTHVYWLTRDGKLRRRDNASKAPPVTLAQGFTVVGDERLRQIALTSKFVVWVTGDSRVLRHGL